MSDRGWTKPFVCRIGLHSRQAAVADPSRPPVVQGNPYVVEMECTRCGTRKLVGLGIGHEQGGPR